MSSQPDQAHPLWKRDRETLDRLIQEGENDYNLVELARLRIRYSHFPGARDIQTDLQKLLDKWGYSEETLLVKTRAIHSRGDVYRGKAIAEIAEIVRDDG
jgi:hypothetical protein